MALPRTVTRSLVSVGALTGLAAAFIAVRRTATATVIRGVGAAPVPR